MIRAALFALLLTCSSAFAQHQGVPEFDGARDQSPNPALIRKAMIEVDLSIVQLAAVSISQYVLASINPQAELELTFLDLDAEGKLVYLLEDSSYDVTCIVISFTQCKQTTEKPAS